VKLDGEGGEEGSRNHERRGWEEKKVNSPGFSLASQAEKKQVYFFFALTRKAEKGEEDKPEKNKDRGGKGKAATKLGL